VIPKTENADPKRATVLSDSDEPKCTKSSTESEEPQRETPNIEKADPLRAKLRSDNDEPICSKS
jgi:hypothetical protein